MSICPPISLVMTSVLKPCLPGCNAAVSPAAKPPTTTISEFGNARVSPCSLADFTHAFTAERSDRTERVIEITSKRKGWPGARDCSHDRLLCLLVAATSPTWGAQLWRAPQARPANRTQHRTLDMRNADQTGAEHAQSQRAA
jgi:hypothetical protein